MSRLLRRASSLVSLLPSCSRPIVSAASPLPLWLLITMIPVASHCCIALRLKSSVLVQCLAPLVPLLSHSSRCSASRLRGGMVACVSSLAGAGATVLCGLRCARFAFRVNFARTHKSVGRCLIPLPPPWEGPSPSEASVRRTRSLAGSLMRRDRVWLWGLVRCLCTPSSEASCPRLALSRTHRR